MLARVANSLYWTGRYIERSEYLARYLNVQYFSTFDAPMSQQKEVVLRSILGVSNGESPLLELPEDTLNEQDVLIEVAFNLTNNNSIFSCVNAARENARNIRYVVSTELWEAINRYYHFTKNYNIDYYKTRGLYDFTMQARQHCAIIRSYVSSTLLHDDIWAFIRLGTHIERAAQVIRILNTKLSDIDALCSDEKNAPLEVYQWIVTLKIFECFDMYKGLHRSDVRQDKVLGFLLSNTNLLRSAAYNLNALNTFLSRLSFDLSEDSVLQFQSGKLENRFRFLEYDEIKDDPAAFLNEALEKIYALHDLIQKEYFD